MKNIIELNQNEVNGISGGALLGIIGGATVMAVNSIVVGSAVYYSAKTFMEDPAYFSQLTAIGTFAASFVLLVNKGTSFAALKTGGIAIGATLIGGSLGLFGVNLVQVMTNTTNGTTTNV